MSRDETLMPRSASGGNRLLQRRLPCARRNDAARSTAPPHWGCAQPMRHAGRRPLRMVMLADENCHGHGPQVRTMTPLDCWICWLLLGDTDRQRPFEAAELHRARAAQTSPPRARPMLALRRRRRPQSARRRIRGNAVPRHHAPLSPQGPAPWPPRAPPWPPAYLCRRPCA